MCNLLKDMEQEGSLPVKQFACETCILITKNLGKINAEEGNEESTS